MTKEQIELPALSVRRIAEITGAWAHVRSDDTIGIARAVEKELTAAIAKNSEDRVVGEPVAYTPGEWFDATTVDLMEAFFRSRLPAIREAAKEHGYAIGVHGSLRRDLDLIAAPWRDGASDADTLADAIQNAACGINMAKHQWEQKPAGRLATCMPICWTHRHGVASDGHIDLSVLAAPVAQPATPVAQPATEQAEAPSSLIEAVDALLDEAPCDCSRKRRHEDGEHLSGCYLFDLNTARLAPQPTASPAQPATEAGQGEREDDELPATSDNWERVARVQNAKLMALTDSKAGFAKLCEVMNRYEALSALASKKATEPMTQEERDILQGMREIKTMKAEQAEANIGESVGVVQVMGSYKGVPSLGCLIDTDVHHVKPGYNLYTAPPQDREDAERWRTLEGMLRSKVRSILERPVLAERHTPAYPYTLQEEVDAIRAARTRGADGGGL